MMSPYWSQEVEDLMIWCFTHKIFHRAYDNLMAKMQEYKAKSKENISYHMKMFPWMRLMPFKTRHITNASKKKKALSEIKLICFD
ncbi:hypothetical protein Ahy_B03g061899 isoform A [Arachis hypogaea]|uniref:Uncharacterized protein n=1 Tax=Arachis hypogaea TaxID=3818 RepID=A0A444ZSD8_ARAHY|nr:hypothetical protein Ahy_B03g061899 isoform A [Arachis hypogaea]